MNNNFEDMGNGIRKKEVRIMVYKPMVEDWELGAREVSMEECARRLRTFAEFWSNPGETRLEMPEEIILNGKVYGHKGFPDGSRIDTSWIKTIERIEKRDEYYGVPHDLMCATTQSGSKYYFYSDTHTAEMGLLLGDIIHLGIGSQN